MTGLRALLGLAVGLYVGSASVAWACSQAEPTPFAIDPSLRDEDKTPPDPFTGLEATVARSPGVWCKDDECTSDSCGSSGRARITFTMPPAAEGKIGYRIVWLKGEVPPAAEFDLSTIWPLGNPTNGKGSVGISIGFEEAESLDAEVALVAVDEAGNESEPSESVHLAFSGCTLDVTGECARPESALDCAVTTLSEDAPANGWLAGFGVACVIGWAVRRRRSLRVR